MNDGSLDDEAKSLQAMLFSTLFTQPPVVSMAALCCAVLDYAGLCYAMDVVLVLECTEWIRSSFVCLCCMCGAVQHSAAQCSTVESRLRAPNERAAAGLEIGRAHV